jgi:hypothetical protein
LLSLCHDKFASPNDGLQFYIKSSTLRDANRPPALWWQVA